jgi:hypothetical protein
MAFAQGETTIPREGLSFRNSHHLGLMWTPNIFHPVKLASNIRHPIGEVLHTRHTQEPVELREGTEYHLVEHYFGRKLVTVDIVTPQAQQQGMDRFKQLMQRDFYYGHADFFPQPFRLINRTFVNSSSFDITEYVDGVMKNEKALNL